MTEEIMTEDNTVEETIEETSTNEPTSLMGGEETSTDEPLQEGQRPEGLSDEFWNEETNSINTEALLKEYNNTTKRMKGLREKLSKTPSSAKSIDDYGNEVSGVNLSEDSVFNNARNAALKSGMSKEQFNTFVEEIIANGGVDLSSIGASSTPKSIDVKAEFAKIGPNAPRIAREVTGWRDQMVNEGILTKEQGELMQSMATTAEALSLFNSLRAINGVADIPAVDSINDGLPSDTEIAKMIADQRYMDGDKDFVKKVDRLLDLRIKAGRSEYLNF